MTPLVAGAALLAATTGVFSILARANRRKSRQDLISGLQTVSQHIDAVRQQLQAVEIKVDGLTQAVVKLTEILALIKAVLEGIDSRQQESLQKLDSLAIDFTRLLAITQMTVEEAYLSEYEILLGNLEQYLEMDESNEFYLSVTKPEIFKSVVNLTNWLTSASYMRRSNGSQHIPLIEANEWWEADNLRHLGRAMNFPTPDQVLAKSLPYLATMISTLPQITLSGIDRSQLPDIQSFFLGIQWFAAARGKLIGTDLDKNHHRLQAIIKIVRNAMHFFEQSHHQQVLIMSALLEKYKQVAQQLIARINEAVTSHFVTGNAEGFEQKNSGSWSTTMAFPKNMLGSTPDLMPLPTQQLLSDLISNKSTIPQLIIAALNLGIGKIVVTYSGEPIASASGGFEKNNKHHKGHGADHWANSRLVRFTVDVQWVLETRTVLLARLIYINTSVKEMLVSFNLRSHDHMFKTFSDHATNRNAIPLPDYLRKVWLKELATYYGPGNDANPMPSTAPVFKGVSTGLTPEIQAEMERLILDKIAHLCLEGNLAQLEPHYHQVMKNFNNSSLLESVADQLTVVRALIINIAHLLACPAAFVEKLGSLWDRKQFDTALAKYVQSEQRANMILPRATQLLLDNYNKVVSTQSQLLARPIAVLQNPLYQQLALAMQTLQALQALELSSRPQLSVAAPPPGAAAAPAPR